MKLPLDRQAAAQPRSPMKSIPPSAVPMRNLTPGPLPRTLLGVGPAGDGPETRARLEILDNEGDQPLLSDDTDQHETQLMLRDAIRAELSLGRLPIPVAAMSAPTGPEASKGTSERPAQYAPPPSPDFREPTPAVVAPVKPTAPKPPPPPGGEDLANPYRSLGRASFALAPSGQIEYIAPHALRDP